MHKQDQLLTQALFLYQEEWLQSYVPEQDSPITFSDHFERRMQKMIRHRRRNAFALLNSARKRVAAVILVFLLLSTTIVLQVDAVRTPIRRFFIELHDFLTQITFHSPVDTSQLPNEMQQFVPGYLPAGYQLSTAHKNGMGYYSEYKNAAGDTMELDQLYINISLHVDTEDAVVENVTVGEYAGIAYFVKGTQNIIWDNGSSAFHLRGSIALADLMQVATSLQPAPAESTTP